MLKEKTGDLIKAALNGEVNVIAHCCNCFNNMGAGIAPQIAKNFPKAKEVDSLTEKGLKDKLGRFTLAYDKGVYIYNLYGQYGFWERNVGKIDLNYYYLTKALEGMRIRHDLISNNEPSLKIGFPLIGCGLAGGDWSVVSQIIETIFEDHDVTIYKL